MCIRDRYFPGWPVEAGFALRTPSEIEPEWMTFMKQQQQGQQAGGPPSDGGEGAAPSSAPMEDGAAGVGVGGAAATRF